MDQQHKDVINKAKWKFKKNTLSKDVLIYSFLCFVVIGMFIPISVIISRLIHR
jgi:hypothetical protein